MVLLVGTIFKHDQVHTTGMDIKQTLDAVAVITLGKDMTFRTAPGRFSYEEDYRGNSYTFLSFQVEKRVTLRARAD